MARAAGAIGIAPTSASGAGAGASTGLPAKVPSVADACSTGGCPASSPGDFTGEGTISLAPAPTACATRPVQPGAGPIETRTGSKAIRVGRRWDTADPAPP